MIYEFEFNELCFNWSKDKDYNEMYIRNMIGGLYDRILHKGYIYLNEIYEAFTAEWDTYEENKVIRYSDHPCDDFITFYEKPEEDNTFIIKVKL